MSDTAEPGTPTAPPAAVPTPTPAPPAPATPPSQPAGTVTLVLTAPWNTSSLVSGVDGWEPITRAGAKGPATSADNVIAAGASSGVTIERR